MPTPPRVFILRMRNVPMIDSSGVAALSDFMRRCRARGVAVIVSGIRPQPKEVLRSEEHTSELQSLMRISYAVFCLKKKKSIKYKTSNSTQTLTQDTIHSNKHLN